MPLEAEAEQLAHHLLGEDFTEIHAHHGVDGIAAGAIVAAALVRAGRNFRLRCTPRIAPADLAGDGGVLLCDLGPAREDLPPHVMILDHHGPRLTGESPADPARGEALAGGEIPAAVAAYLVARHMGENRDLAGIALLGILGDGQVLSGANREIVNEGIANGFITPGRGVLLPGRDLVEGLTLAIHPHLDGISGEEAAARRVVEECTADGRVALDALLSLVVLRAGATASAGALEALYGDTYTLEREGVPDAHTLAALVDACGRSGAGGLAAALLLSRAAPGKEAWEAMRAHRLRVVAGIRSAQPLDVEGWYGVGDPEVNGPVAEALALSTAGERPVAVFSSRGDAWHVSIRCPPGVRMDPGPAIRVLARSCEGDGGGHRCRAGATVPARHLDRFRKGLAEAIAG